MTLRIAALVMSLLMLACGELRARAQSDGIVATAVLDRSVGDALRSLGTRAGIAFVGQVSGIERKAGVVEVTFHVLQAVVGNPGASYTLREWSGLWTGGRSRYHVGEWALFFFHAAKGTERGEPGLSSPVDGMDGIVPLVPMGVERDAVLDVRRLAARVVRAQGQAMVGEAVGLQDAVRVVSARRSEVRMEPELLSLQRAVRANAGAVNGR